MSRDRINRISGHVILALSLFALLLVGGATVLTVLGRFTPSPDRDEGSAAHLFQLSVALLVPSGLTYLGSADWRRPWAVAKRLLTPAVALAAAFAMLAILERNR